jgi:hypothetical protein
LGSYRKGRRPGKEELPQRGCHKGRSIIQDSYLYNDTVILRFDSRKHSYTVIDNGNEIVVPSVTKILGVISKGDALIQWAANQVVACVKEKISVEEVYSGDYIHEVSDECKYAFKRKKQEAADIGTEAHSRIEQKLYSRLDSSGVETQSPDSMHQPREVCGAGPSESLVNNCVDAASEWLRLNEVVPVSIERRIYSRRYGYSGTADLVALVKGKTVVVDWKSSKGLYPEYHLQTAAYAKAIEEETGQRISGRILVRLGKEDGAFEVKELPYRYQLEADYQAFLAAKKLYDWQQNNKK